MRIHTGERNFACECGKRFQRMQHLKEHMLAHRGKTFHCPQEGCGLSFSAKSTLSVHLKKHNEVHNNKVFYCCSVESCGRKYSSKSTLRQHMKKFHSSVTLDVEQQTYMSTFTGDDQTNLDPLVNDPEPDSELAHAVFPSLTAVSLGALNGSEANLETDLHGAYQLLGEPTSADNFLLHFPASSIVTQSTKPSNPVLSVSTSSFLTSPSPSRLTPSPSPSRLTPSPSPSLSGCAPTSTLSPSPSPLNSNMPSFLGHIDSLYLDSHVPTEGIGGLSAMLNGGTQGAPQEAAVLESPCIKSYLRCLGSGGSARTDVVYTSRSVQSAPPVTDVVRKNKRRKADTAMLYSADNDKLHVSLSGQPADPTSSLQSAVYRDGTHNFMQFSLLQDDPLQLPHALYSRNDQLLTSVALQTPLLEDPSLALPQSTINLQDLE